MMTNIESRNRRFLMRLSIAAVWALVAAGELQAALKIAPQKYPAGKRDWNAWLPYVASHKPSRRANPAIKRVLISIHSSGYDALQYYENARAAASKVRGATDETLIIAPQFLLKRVIPGPVPPGMLYWRTAPYRGSSRAAIGKQGKPVSLSAFQVLDDMLKQLCTKKTFPNLRDVVLVGHSAGGQMVQRYALAGRFEPPAGIRCRFVVCAPSSFAYPTDERKVPGPGMKFAKPTGATLEAAPSYNN